MAYALLLRAFLLAGLWWLLTGGDTTAWLVGIPAIVLAVAVSGLAGVSSMPRLSIGGLLRFSLHFIKESALGGLDVTRRVLGRKLQIQPGFREYRLSPRPPLERTLLANCISLLPGTLAVDMEDERLIIHVLDIHELPDRDIEQLELAIAGIFGSAMENRHD
jgi:multicomponent Na+:H+ antiporter subunit E